MNEELKNKLIELDKKKAEVKKYYEELAEVLAAIGIGKHFQDPASGTVFEIIEPDGKFVKFDKFSYVRTKKEGEVRGELSVKRAEELGYKVK
jgi:hypothetical protein